MRAHIVFAEKASFHSEGTYSLVRGGLSSFESREGIAHIKGDLLITVQHDFGDAGAHVLRLRTIGEDGETILGGVEGSFDTPPTSGRFHLAVRLTGELPTGSYEVHASIDACFVASWPLEVCNRLPQTAGGTRPEE